VRRVLRDLFGSHSFGLVLIMIVVTIVVTAVFESDWGVAVRIVLQGGTTMLALWAAKVPRRVFLACGIGVTIAVVTAIGALVQGEDVSRGVAGLVTLLLIAAVPAAIVYGLRNTEEPTLQTVSGALCIYLLIGLFFSVLYDSIQRLGSGPFFVQITDPDVTDFLYFSYVTLTTVGYGDLTAVGDFGRMMSALEALIGQLYLVTVVALVVSSVGQRRRSAEKP
jgi:hypothetical protein